jgi:hypothetical protein
VGTNHLSRICNGEVIRRVDEIIDAYLFCVEVVLELFVKITEFLIYGLVPIEYDQQ